MVVIIAPNNNGGESMRRGDGTDGPMSMRAHLSAMAHPRVAVNGQDGHIMVFGERTSFPETA
jgi:hypothetical protein